MAGCGMKLLASGAVPLGPLGEGKGGAKLRLPSRAPLLERLCTSLPVPSRRGELASPQLRGELKPSIALGSSKSKEKAPCNPGKCEPPKMDDVSDRALNGS
jgi:hypothetical protein